MKKILGLAVEDSVYEKYHSNRYDVDGKKLPLRGIEVVLRSEEYARELPEYTEAVRKVAERIKNEIKEYYNLKDGRDEYAAMKHERFSGYIKDLQEIHKEVTPKRIELKKAAQIAEDEWRRMLREPEKYSEYDKAKINYKYQEAVQNYKENVKELQTETGNKISAIRNEFEKHLVDFYEANGSRIDETTVRLLNSGIKLRDEEISKLVDRYDNNITMLRLIADHCESKGINNKWARVFKTKAGSCGSEERTLFDTVVGLIEAAVGRDESRVSVWTDPGRFGDISAKTVAAMDNIWIKPETVSE